MDAPLPKKIGRYEIDRLLGSGAMGHVYLGRDTELDRAVAIKTVRDLGMDADQLETFLERFKNEARAAAKLHHPTIVQVYDVGEDPESGPYLVFEYVAGSTLKQVLRSKGPMEPAAAVALVAQVATALDLAHERGIIHRDLKPDNLLVGNDGSCKLADFGVARMPDAALTREGQFLGTPCYAAPETLTEGSYGRETDIFSFAALIYELVSGARAFPGTDAVAVAHKVIHEQPRPPSEVAKAGVSIPGAVDAVVMRALSKKPGTRPRHASQLAAELADAYRGAGLLPEGVGPRSSAIVTPGADEGGGGSFAFIAVLAGGLAVGIALVFAFDGGLPGGETRDAGIVARDAAALAARTDASGSDAGAGAPDEADAGTRHGRGDASASDAGGGPDAGPADAGRGPMTGFDREQAAKDEIDDARAHLRAGRIDEARAALTRASSLDPENGDIEELAASIARAREDTDGADGAGDDP